jgi:hypothetical protein
MDTLLFEVLEYIETKTSELGTTETNVFMTNHGLNTDDFIVNTTRRATLQSQGERGSRRVLEVISVNEFRIASIPNQNRNDSFRIYKFNDRTSAIKAQTLKLDLKLSGESQSSFTCLSNNTITAYYPLEGQMVRYSFNGVVLAVNIIDSVTRTLLNETSDIVVSNISTRDLKSILSRRNIRINYNVNDLTSDIIKAIVDNVLVNEGIERGKIDTGISLNQEWKNGCINLRQVVDSLAEKNGFQWWVSSTFKLNFLDEESIIPDAPFIISDAPGESFKDFKNVSTSGYLSGYTNKVFTVGNDDGYGNQIFTAKSDITSQNYMQNLVCGSGVYGTIIQDENNSEVLEKNTLSGTTETNLNVSYHTLKVGDYVFNLTLQTGTYVTEVINTGNVEVEQLVGQLPGQKVLIFISSLNRTNELLNKNKRTPFSKTAVPRVLTFDTGNTTFRPGTKLEATLQKFGIGVPTYFAIESVTINDLNGCGDYLCNVVAIQRDTETFSTHKRYNGFDYFAKNY